MKSFHGIHAEFLDYNLVSASLLCYPLLYLILVRIFVGTWRWFQRKTCSKWITNEWEFFSDVNPDHPFWVSCRRNRVLGVYSNSELSITGFIIAWNFDILLRIFNVVMLFVLYVFRSIWYNLKKRIINVTVFDAWLKMY